MLSNYNTSRDHPIFADEKILSIRRCYHRPLPRYDALLFSHGSELIGRNRVNQVCDDAIHKLPHVDLLSVVPGYTTTEWMKRNPNAPELARSL